MQSCTLLASDCDPVEAGSNLVKARRFGVFTQNTASLLTWQVATRAAGDGSICAPSCVAGQTV